MHHRSIRAVIDLILLSSALLAWSCGGSSRSVSPQPSLPSASGTGLPAEAVIPKAQSAADCPIISVSSDSVLGDEGQQGLVFIKYDARSAFDGSDSTAWAEGEPDDGIGSAMTITLAPQLKESLTLDEIGIKAGFFTPSGYGRNNRVAAFELRKGERTWNFTVPDEMREIRLPIDPPLVIESSVPTLSIDVAITAVHPGSAYRDTCISEFALYSAGEPLPALIGSGIRFSPEAKSYFIPLDAWEGIVSLPQDDPEQAGALRARVSLYGNRQYDLSVDLLGAHPVPVFSSTGSYEETGTSPVIECVDFTLYWTQPRRGQLSGLWMKDYNVETMELAPMEPFFPEP